MTETFDRILASRDSTLSLCRNFQPDHPRPIVRTLPTWLAEFKKRHVGHPYAHGMVNGTYNFRFDCVRFAHKVAAVTDAAKLDVDILIWADADTVLTQPSRGIG